MMMMDAGNKLSLVSQFDDLCRYGAIFHEGLEADFLKFVRNQELCRLRWLQTERDLNALREEFDVTFQELNEWKSMFQDTRTKLLAEQKRRTEAEQRLRELTKLFGEVREVVNRDSTITDQTKERFAMWQKYEPMEPITENETPEQSIEYDLSGEVLDFDGPARDQQSSRRQSGALNSPRRKRSLPENVQTNSRHGASIVSTTTVNVPSHGGDIVATTKLNAFRQESLPVDFQVGCLQGPPSKRRSRSEPEAIVLVEPSAPLPPPPPIPLPLVNGKTEGVSLYPTKLLESLVQLPQNNQTHFTRTTPKSASTNSLPLRQNSGSKLNGKAHDFASKTVIRPETCLPCGRRIKFSKQALKCHNCRATCHPECKASVPLPCIPVCHTPNKAGVTLASLAPSEPPRVPALIVHCVKELDTRAHEVGMYRLSAPEREVKELKEKFLKGKGIPNMKNVDIHVIGSLIKDFLRSLDPLVPKLMWKDFCDAAEKAEQEDSPETLYHCVSQLPLPNRDTLAFLMLHWQGLADDPAVKMPVKNLATVLGPTVVGYSSQDLSFASMLKEQVSQVKLMEKLLLLPRDYWFSFLSEPEEKEGPLFSNILKPSDLITPESRSARTLKPVNTAKSETPRRAGTLPRRPTTRQQQQQKFFASPSLH